MSKQKTNEELLLHKENSINDMILLLEELINSPEESNHGKADKLCYWITDWCKFLRYEPQFTPTLLRRYKRGEIVKVHLGFNIGSEEGGLHYAVVLDKNNAKSCPTLTVVPLTSVKPTTNLSALKDGTVYLGNELYISLNAKITATSTHLRNEVTSLKDMISDIQSNNPSADLESINERIEKCCLELDLLNRLKREVSKMKSGSLALVNQITTISKIRIYDPKTDHDVLSSIKLSNEKLDILDETVRKKYTNL